MFEGAGASEGMPLVRRTAVHLVGRTVAGLTSTCQGSGTWVLRPDPGSVNADDAIAGEIEAQQRSRDSPPGSGQS